MITVHSFMFTSSHETVREKIIRETAIETMVHLGTRSFEDLSNRNAQGFVMYALRKSTGKTNDEGRGVYFRLVKEISISHIRLYRGKSPGTGRRAGRIGI